VENQRQWGIPIIHLQFVAEYIHTLVKSAIFILIMKFVCSLFIVLFFLSSLDVCSQEFEKKLIVKDNGDSLLLNTGDVNFDRAGNYCFETKKDDIYFVITNVRKYGPFTHVGGFYGGGGELKTYAETGDYNSITKKYYKNGKGTSLYGPVSMGEDNEIVTSDTRNNIALLTKIDNKVYVHINSTFVAELNIEDKPWFWEKWCRFSENGDVFYSLKNGNMYRFYKNFKLVDSGKANTYFSTQKKDEPRCPESVEVPGKAYAKVECPASDSAGNCSYFGLRNYFLYLVTNGIEQKSPLSKYGVRAKPLSTSGNGDYWCLYKTDDTSYVYHNEHLVVKNANSKIRLLGTDDIIRYYYKGNTSQLFGFCSDRTCFVVYNNAISPPILEIPQKGGDTLRLGTIMCSGFDEHGYWLIQKIGYKKYQLVINNKVFSITDQIVDETDRTISIIQNNCFLTGQEFIFYGQQRDCFYQYKLNL
jgi:hypothetical protein